MQGILSCLVVLHVPHSKGASGFVNNWQALAVGQVPWPSQLSPPDLDLDPRNVTFPQFWVHHEQTLSTLHTLRLCALWSLFYRFSQVLWLYLQNSTHSLKPVGLLNQPVNRMKKDQMLFIERLLRAMHRDSFSMPYLVILPVNLWDGFCYYPHFTDEKTNAQLLTQGHTFKYLVEPEFWLGPYVIQSSWVYLLLYTALSIFLGLASQYHIYILQPLVRVTGTPFS